MSINPLLEGLNDALFVSIGGVLGAWLRFYLVNKLRLIFSNNYCCTFVVNMLATFSLALLLGLHAQNGYIDRGAPQILFFCVGFLGSLSTFSTFIFEAFERFSCNHFKDGLFIITASVLGGLAAAMAGYAFGYV